MIFVKKIKSVRIGIIFPFPSWEWLFFFPPPEVMDDIWRRIFHWIFRLLYWWILVLSPFHILRKISKEMNKPWQFTIFWSGNPVVCWEERKSVKPELRIGSQIFLVSMILQTLSEFSAFRIICVRITSACLCVFPVFFSEMVYRYLFNQIYVRISNSSSLLLAKKNMLAFSCSFFLSEIQWGHSTCLSCNEDQGGYHFFSCSLQFFDDGDGNNFQF